MRLRQKDLIKEIENKLGISEEDNKSKRL